MKLLATLDFWDGSPGKVKEVYLEEVTGPAILRSLMEKGVATISFTMIPNLLKVLPPEEGGQ